MSKFTFTCDKVTYKPNGNGGLASYDIEGINQGELFYCDLKEIEAITYIIKRSFWS